MYDPIFAKSFSRYERKGFGCCALALCFILAISICSTFKPHWHPLSLIGDAANLKLSIDDIQDVLTTNDAMEITEPKVGDTVNLPTDHSVQDVPTSTDMIKNSEPKVGDTVNLPTDHSVQDVPSSTDMIKNSEPKVHNAAANLQLSMNGAENMHLVNETSVISQPKEIEKMVKPLCRKISGGADLCEIEGDIRIQPNTATIFVVAPRETISNSTSLWHIQPYPRKNMAYVKYWTVKVVANDNEQSNIPKCTQTHSKPAMLFSMGGFSGNHFHDFADMLFPLYTTSFRFQKEVHFLASDFKKWWIGKYQKVLSRLSRHQVVDIDKEQEQVRCYQQMVVGLDFYRELVVDQSSLEDPNKASMSSFRQLLQQTYSLQRKRTTKSRKGDKKAPRLLIVSRQRTRKLTNEVEVSRLATKLGFEVVSAEADTSTDLSRFTQLVNSCDIMMGIHGAGLTNMLFLPDNAILIQLVPLGKIDIFARLDFGDPAAGMNIRYLEYKISTKESSLSEQYPSDHPVLKDPISIHKKGWLMIKSVYLDNQNITVDVRRFRGTLVKAMKLFRS